jgi:hypothetical protein
MAEEEKFCRVKLKECATAVVPSLRNNLGKKHGYLVLYLFNYRPARIYHQTLRDRTMHEPWEPYIITYN